LQGVLVIDDEPTLAGNIQKYLQKAGYEVKVAHEASEGLEQMREFGPDAVILDYRLPGMDGLAALREIRRIDPKVKVLMITAHGSIEVAIEAIRAGAFDYLHKPVVLSELKLAVEKALGQNQIESTLEYYQAQQASKGGLAAIVGESASIRELRAQVRQVLNAEAALKDAPPPVLITGETGTGKELVARALHFDGRRAEGNFIELNCATLPEHLIEAELFGHERGAFTDAKERKLGLIEAAHGGTLFLDEIGEMPSSAQVKLLRVLEDRAVRRLGAVRDRTIDVRLVAATNRSLPKMMNDGEFRSDLYYRLTTITLTLPPVRERQGDIPLLAEFFLDIFGRRYRRNALRFSKQALAALEAHDWPGNVRELRNAVERAVMLASGDLISADHLALAGSPSAAGSDRYRQRLGNGAFELPEEGLKIEELERDLITQALTRTKGNVTKAARLLGLTRDTLRYRIDKFDLG